MRDMLSALDFLPIYRCDKTMSQNRWLQSVEKYTEKIYFFSEYQRSERLVPHVSQSH